jgi:GDPmannose 4,6-dehydratase
MNIKDQTNKTAVIFGVGGQDGFYLSQLLLQHGYTVVGVVRRTSSDSLWRLKDLPRFNDLIIEKGDVTDPLCIGRLLQKYEPDEVYNLAAQSHVGTSYDQPHLTVQITGIGCLNILEAIRTFVPYARFYQAGTSEMFGNNYTETADGRKVQNEKTAFAPRSPYACAKAMAYDLVRTYREAYGLWAVCCILMNHESPYRGEDFVTRKITKHLARLYYYGEDCPKLKLGNITTVRDFGHAGDYVMAMWKAMQRDTPKDYVIGVGAAHSVRDFLYACFDYLNFQTGVIDSDQYEDLYEIDSALFRPTDVDYLQADASLAMKELDWKPRVTFDKLVAQMMEADIERTVNEAKKYVSNYTVSAVE